MICAQSNTIIILKYTLTLCTITHPITGTSISIGVVPTIQKERPQTKE